MASVIILAAWVVALGGLVSRDVMKTDSQRLSDLALRVNPGNVFYSVELDGRHIGWASSTIDTLTDTLLVSDALVADIPVGATRKRTTLRTQVVLSRNFVVRSFTSEAGLAASPTRIRGHVEGDTGIAYVIETAGVVGDTQHVRVTGPVLMPTLVPLAAILGGKPKPGRHVQYTTFDPATLSARAVALDVQAESLFVVEDSARMDAGTGRWVVALHDTVRAWKLGSADSLNFSGWVDAQGRVVETTALKTLRLKRTAYEIAFENWRLNNAETVRDSTKGTFARTTASSAISSRAPFPAAQLSYLRIRLTSREVNPLDLRDGRQTVDGDVVTIRREDSTKFVPAYSLPPSAPFRTQYAHELAAEPGLEVHVPFINAQAVRTAGHDLHDARAIVASTVRWVHDSVGRDPSCVRCGAVEVLKARRGDCDDHARVFTALTRTMGVPTRIVAGVIYISGMFYYHAWTEVYLDTWVAVDPTFGQFPADAAHLRLTSGGIPREAEMRRLIGTLHIEVLEAR